MSLGDGVLVWGLGPSAAFRGFAYAFWWGGQRPAILVGVRGGLVVVLCDAAGVVDLLGVDGGGHLLGIAGAVVLPGIDDVGGVLGLVVPTFCIGGFGHLLDFVDDLFGEVVVGD